MYLDEMDNDQLREALKVEFAGTPAVNAELKRVDALIERLALTGTDLSYWNQRRRILHNAKGAQVVA